MARRITLPPVFDEIARAQAQLVQAQAQLVLSHAQLELAQASLREETRRHIERIDRQFERIMATLLRHEEILQKLPDAVREKIGFKN